MPLPWKKAKVTRISQFVADLQSPNRGGSLVVETGFPNSLIDLFVKNRDRLKKQKPPPLLPPSKKKKRNNNHNNNQVEISDRAIIRLPSPPPPPSSCVNSDKFWGPAVSRIESFGCRQSCADVDVDVDVDKDLFVDDQVAVAEKNQVKKSAALSGIFVAIMKILIVVVLAMATKKLAVGITLSASALLFIEYVGKRMVCFFDPCLKLLSSSKFLIFRRVEIVESNSSCCCTIDEIEIEDSSSSSSRTDLVIANEPDSDTPLNRRHERLGHEEKEEETLQLLRMRDLLEEEDEEIMEHQNRRRRSRGAKFKAKVMKKFAPKKEKKCIAVCNNNYTGVEKLSILEEQGNELLVKEIEIDENKSSHSLSSFEQNQGEKQQEEEKLYDDDDGGDRSSSSSSREILMANSTPIVSEKTGIKKKRSLRSLILILLILAGLVGGRSIALVLTFGWWLCLKSVGSLKKQSSVPMMSFLLSKFSKE